jgi:hypothetical protein
VCVKSGSDGDFFAQYASLLCRIFFGKALNLCGFCVIIRDNIFWRGQALLLKWNQYPSAANGLSLPYVKIIK